MAGESPPPQGVDVFRAQVSMLINVGQVEQLRLAPEKCTTLICTTLYTCVVFALAHFLCFPLAPENLDSCTPQA
jgi:hypothetical protein